MSLDELKAAAVAMLDRAYCPYSHFPVGAAVECADGTVFTGCNIENAVYPVGTCAERTAIFRAVFDGQRDFTAIAIVGGPAGQPVSELCAPCGVCRQVMMEFCDPATFRILMGTGGDTFEERTLQQMLPFGFGPANLGK